MLEFLKKYRYHISITVIYTVLATLVYGIWSFSAWHLWYVTMIISVIILLIGCVVGYVWIKSEISKEKTVEDDKK